MKPHIVSVVQRYGFAIFSTMLATWARMCLNGVLGDRVPFGFYFISVFVTAWIAGTGPAVVALAGGILAAAHWIIEPHDSWWVPDAADQMALFVYGIIGAIAIVLFHRSAVEAVLLQQRACENEELSGRLRDADTRKDEFLALLAHELRNPLAPIRAGLCVLERETSLSAEGCQVKQILRRQVEQLVRIVDDLFDVSRFLRGQLRMDCSLIDLRQSVDLAVQTVEPIIAEAQHDLRFLRPSEPVFVRGDEVRLTQAVANLLTNAARYTPRSGRIRVMLDETDGEVRLQVTDNGIGIAPAAQPHIFNLFTQENSTHTRDHGGLGLGLAIVRQIMELHSGTVSLRSDGPGRGCCFELSLPAAAAPAPRSRNSAPPRLDDDAPDDNSLPGRRVMIVDDNRDAAQTLATLLAYDGYAIQVAHDGHMALNNFDDFDPDVVLLDIGMPGMDGYEVARRLRSRRSGKRSKIIAVTGWGQDSDRQMSHQSGINHHVVKPVDIGQLLQLIAGIEAQEQPRLEIEHDTTVS